MKNIALTLITSMMALSVQATTQEDIKSFTLDNGMKILVLEDSSIPNANMYLFWKVGSRNEVPGITGISHFFEHMMFNGSAKFGPKMFDRTMEAWPQDVRPHHGSCRRRQQCLYLRKCHCLHQLVPGWRHGDYF